MPRKPRFFLPDVPVHVVQRGHSREPVFFEDDDYFARLKGSDPFTLLLSDPFTQQLANNGLVRTQSY